jgi:hypothetical protein
MNENGKTVRESERKKQDLKTSISTKAVYVLLGILVLFALAGLLATSPIGQITGANQGGMANPQLLGRLKLVWIAVSVSSTLAALGFAWLRAQSTIRATFGTPA